MGVLKKLVLFLAVLVGLLVIAAVAIPFFVDVDKYRPKMVELANVHLNGKLELGKLALSLWGHLRVEVDGLTLTDGAGRPVVSVKNAYFHLPFASVVSGSPSLILQLESPAVDVTKDRKGKLNVLSLVKSQAAAPATPSGGGGAAPESKTVTLPGIVTRASFGMELKHALLGYRDELSGMNASVKDLDVSIRNLSLTREMSLLATANIDTELKTAAKPGQPEGAPTIVKGPFKLTAQARPTLVNDKFDHLDASANLDLDGLDVSMGPLFHKSPGMAANLDLTVTASQSAAKVEKLAVHFFNADIEAQGTVTHLGGAAGTAAASAPPVEAEAPAVVDFEVKSNTIELKPWNQLVPMLKDYDLAGTAQFSAAAHGPSTRLGYKALVRIDALTAKAPQLRSEPRIDAELSVVTDQVDKLMVSLKAPANDLTIQGKIASFTHPQATFTINSTGLDLDQLIEFPPAIAAPAQAQAKAPEGKGAAPAPVSPANLDAMLDPLRRNALLAGTNAEVTVKMKLIKAKGVAVSDLGAKLSLHDLTAALESFSMKVFGGSIGMSLQAALKPETPNYRFSAHVADLDLQQASSSSMQLFKNTLLGRASFDLAGTGASFNTEPAEKNLDAKGKLRVDNATFASVDIGKMVSDALDSSIDRLGDKVPGLKGKKVGNLPQGESKYESISTDFTISHGAFSAPDFVAKSIPGKGVDLKGTVTAGILDKTVKTNWEVVDTYNATRAKDLSANIAGTEIPHILAQGNNPVTFPVSAEGPLSNPRFNYSEVPVALGKVVAANTTGAIKGRAQQELQKRAGSLIKQAPPAVQNQLNNLGKKLFGG